MEKKTSWRTWGGYALVVALAAVVLLGVDQVFFRRELPPPTPVAATPPAVEAPAEAPAEEVDAGPEELEPSVAALPPVEKPSLDPRRRTSVSDARCTPEVAAAASRFRAELLQRFKRMESRGFTIDFDPAITPEFPLAILDAATDAERSVAAVVGRAPEARAPFIVLYRDAEQMRSASCVRTESAVGHYDGAIHLSADDREGVESLRETIIHESMHHVLRELGVDRPLWLQEGLAMLASGEQWWAAPSLGLREAAERSGGLSLRELEGVLSAGGDPHAMSTAYYQSLRRVMFLRAHMPEGSFENLVRALGRGAVPPENVFTYGAGANAEALWRDSLRTPP